MTSVWLQDYNLINLEEIDSTNTEALRLANLNVNDKTVIVSKKQTSGRGQKSRDWVSLEGNLHASILLNVDIDRFRLPELSFIMSNTIYEVVEFFAKKNNLSLDLKLKWPNDVLVDEKKIAGILLESISLSGKNYVVIGFSVNLLKTPIIENRIVTSLIEEGLIILSSNEFLDELMNKFNFFYKEWLEDNNFSKTRDLWLTRAYNLNKPITIDNGVDVLSGMFRGIGQDGSLKIELSNGKIRAISSGELY